jgi:hypothetical protein
MTRRFACILLPLLLLAACGPLIRKGDPRPGSLEDCVAWDFAEVEAAPDDYGARTRLADRLEIHYLFARSTGSSPREILARQQALLNFGRNRPPRPGDAATRAKCLAKD